MSSPVSDVFHGGEARTLPLTSKVYDLKTATSEARFRITLVARQEDRFRGAIRQSRTRRSMTMQSFSTRSHHVKPSRSCHGDECPQAQTKTEPNCIGFGSAAFGRYASVQYSQCSRDSKFCIPCEVSQHARTMMTRVVSIVSNDVKHANTRWPSKIHHR